MKNKKYLVLLMVILGALILSCGSKRDKTGQKTEVKTEKKSKYSFDLSDEDLATAHSPVLTGNSVGSRAGDRFQPRHQR